MEIWARTGKTILFVTHDISESVLLSDRVIVLGRGGRVLSDEKIDVPRPRASEEDRLFEIERRMRVLAAAWWAEPGTP
jgi:NitT/TauT family transport system ATP-binding protein